MGKIEREKWKEKKWREKLKDGKGIRKGEWKEEGNRKIRNSIHKGEIYKRQKRCIFRRDFWKIGEREKR